jgi:hypothetical protein
MQCTNNIPCVNIVPNFNVKQAMSILSIVDNLSFHEYSSSTRMHYMCKIDLEQFELCCSLDELKHILLDIILHNIPRPHRITRSTNYTPNNQDDEKINNTQLFVLTQVCV